MAHEEIISETLKNYLTSSNTLQKKKTYMISLATLGKSKNIYNTACFLYLIQTYCHHICLFHYTYKFNCFYMKFSPYITIYTCLSKTILIHTLHINFFGCKCPIKTSYQKHGKTMLCLAINFSKITS